MTRRYFFGGAPIRLRGQPVVSVQIPVLTEQHAAYEGVQ